MRKELRSLKTLQFIQNKENAIFIGNPGTGKTHFSIGLGIEACLQGYNVLFINAPNLVIQMKEAVTQSQFYRFKQRLQRIDLLIIDELGYLSFDALGAELIFNLLSNRIGVVEGTNNKIKNIKRSGYGYRNFQNLRYRILICQTLTEKKRKKRPLLFEDEKEIKKKENLRYKAA